MKKQTNIFCVILILAITCCRGYAQTVAFNPKSVNKASTTSVVGEKIADNVQKKFSKNFPGITGELWSRINNGYEVVFKTGNIQNRVFLTRNGNLNYQISYYSEAELPADVRSRVKSVYFDYNIFCVQEINHNKTKIYLVTLEDKCTWKIVHIDENDMEIYKEYVKR